MKKHLHIPEIDKKDNRIGFVQNKVNREIAKNLISAGQFLEENRAKRGYKYVTDGRTQKQVHPDKVQSHLDNGWKLTHQTVA